jgi:hypothetical protein
VTHGVPSTWDDAARLVLDSILDMKDAHTYASMPDASACQQSIIDEFDDIVENVFTYKTESDVIEEQFFDIAMAALAGFAFEKKTTMRRASKEVHATLVGKQRMYGHGNIARFGIPGITIRLNDKLERLKNLQRHDGPVLFEPLHDTWLDICGYATIAIMWEKGWFLLNLKASNQDTSAKSGAE